MGSTNTILEGDRSRSILASLISFHPAVLEKNIKDFQFSNKSEDMATILNVQKGHRTPFLKWPPKEYHIQVWSNFNHSWNTSWNRRSTWEKLTDDGCLMVEKAHMCLWLWWAKRNFWYNTEEYLIFVCLILPLYEHESEKKNSFLVRK